MAVGILTGFESGDSSECIATAGTFSIQGTVTRGAWSAYALRTNPTTTGTGRARISGHSTTGAASASAFSAATIYIRFYFRVDTLPAASDEEIIRILDTAGNSKGYLRIDSTGKLTAYEATPTAVSTGTAVLSTGVWYRIEIKWGSGAGGVVEWKVDGVVDVSTTATLGATSNGEFDLGKAQNRNGKTVDYYYDDVLASDSAYPGPGQCAVLIPNGVGNYQTWTIGAGSGSNWQNVDEVPPNGDTDYLLSPLIANDFETEALTNGSTFSIAGTVNAVKSCATLKQDVAGGTVRVALRSASTDDVTAANYTGTASYVLIAKVYGTDPATSAAWTVAALDSVETGAECTSAVNQVRMTFTALMVDWAPPTDSFPAYLQPTQYFDNVEEILSY